MYSHSTVLYSCHLAYISFVTGFSIWAYEWSWSGGWNRKSNHKQNQDNGYNHRNKYSKMPICDILQYNYKKCIIILLFLCQKIKSEYVNKECATLMWEVNTALAKDDARSRCRLSLVVNIIKCSQPFVITIVTVSLRLTTIVYIVFRSMRC